MTTAQDVKTSITNNSLSKDYPHLNDHAEQIDVYVLIEGTWNIVQEGGIPSNLFRTY